MVEQKDKSQEEELNFFRNKRIGSAWQRVREHSEETKAKIRLARSKQINTPESNKKRSETQKGRIFSAESKEKMRQHALKRFADKKNHPYYGKKFSQEHLDNMSKALKGRSLLDLHTPQRAEEIRAKIKEKRKQQVLPLKDSSIELKIQDFLTELQVEFLTHKYMNIENSYQCDIFIPSTQTVIECDGDFFHCNPELYSADHIPFPNNKRSMTAKKRWKLDDDRTQQLMKKGFKVMRLWEGDIKKMSLDDFKQKLEQHEK